MRFLLCLMVSIPVLTASGQGIDYQALKHLNVQRNTELDGAMIFLSESANPLSMLAPVTSFGLGVLTSSKSKKRKGIYMAQTMAVNGIITLATKYSIDRPRPFTTYSAIHKLSAGGSPSFPSGHTSNAFATATALTLAFPKWYVVVPSYAWASAVGYSRMHTGVHYPSDVLVGAAVGIASAYLCQFMNQQVFKTYKRPQEY
jgi:membrane-associated phospholipid phosphatase